MQSLGSMMHFDFNQPGAYSYEQALQACLLLDLPIEDREQQVRRAYFNVIARNQDDHVKNIAFLMDRAGAWRLSPAFDLAYSYNPDGAWTGKHQMSINGKRDGFERDDLVGLAKVAGIKKQAAIGILNQVVAAVSRWSEFAQLAGVSPERTQQIAEMFRLRLV